MEVKFKDDLLIFLFLFDDLYEEVSWLNIRVFGVFVCFYSSWFKVNFLGLDLFKLLKYILNFKVSIYFWIDVFVLFVEFS